MLEQWTARVGSGETVRQIGKVTSTEKTVRLRVGWR